jgi:hypothetical protein
MAIDVICDQCGTECAADGSLLGQSVECPICSHVFTASDTALALNRPTPKPPAAGELRPDFEVYAPAPVAPPWSKPSLNTTLFGWGDGCGLGRGPAAAIMLGVLLAVFGIVSPVPLWMGMVLLPVWAVGYFLWGLPQAKVRQTRRDGWDLAGRPRYRQGTLDTGTLFARAAMIAGAGAAVAMWGFMVHGRAAFDFAPAVSHRPVASVDAGGPPPAAPATDVPPSTASVGVADPSALVATPPARSPAVEPPAVPPPPVVSAVVTPAPAVAPPAGPKVSDQPAPAADADNGRARDEEVSSTNLRALSRAVADYAGRYGRYPTDLDQLPKSAALRAVRRSPFAAATSTAASYAFPAAGRPVAAGDATGLAVLYDAAELAEHGVTVGITSTGRLVYLDADQVTEERATWQRH